MMPYGFTIHKCSQWCHMASQICAVIKSGNGLMLKRWQAITLTKDGAFHIRPCWVNQRNFEKVVSNFVINAVVSIFVINAWLTGEWHWTIKSKNICRNINTLRPRQNVHHFPDNIFMKTFLNENGWISIKISVKFVPKGPINNIPALVEIMTWRHCLNQWWLIYWRMYASLGLNELMTKFGSGTHWGQVTSVNWSSLVQVIACHLFGAKPLPEPMLAYCQVDSWEQISVKFE